MSALVNWLADARHRPFRDATGEGELIFFLILSSELSSSLSVSASRFNVLRVVKRRSSAFDRYLLDFSLGSRSAAFDPTTGNDAVKWYSRIIIKNDKLEKQKSQKNRKATD